MDVDVQWVISAGDVDRARAVVVVRFRQLLGVSRHDQLLVRHGDALTITDESSTGRIARCVLIPAASMASCSLFRCIQVTVKIAAIMPITPQS